MSVSIFEAPDTVGGNKITSIDRPTIWEFQSNRVGAETISILSVVENITFMSPEYDIGLHTLEVGDVFTVSGTSEPLYNVKQVVVFVTETSVVSNVDGVGAASAGTMVKENENFRIKATVYKGDGDHNVISTITNHAGNARFTLAAADTSIAIGDSVAVSGTTKTYSITNIADSGAGKAEYTVGAHVLVAGDTFNVPTNSIDVAYNGVQQVIRVTGTTIISNKDFTSGGAATGDVDFQLYDGIHTVSFVFANIDITVSTPFTDTTTVGKLIEVGATIGGKRQQQVTVDGSDLFRFNFSNLIKSQLSFDLATITSGNEVITPTLGSITNYTVTLTEQFDDENGLRVDGHSIQTEVDYKGCNTTWQHTDVQNLNAFTIDDATKRILTNQPQTNLVGQLYKAGDMVQLHFLTEETDIAGEIAQFDDDFASTAAVITTPTKTVGIDRGILKVDTSTFAAATTIFTAHIKTGAGAQRSEKIQMNLDKVCRDRAVKIVFLNRLGGFDHYRFTGDLTEGVAVRKTMYEKGLSKDFLFSDRGESIIGTKAFEEREIWSDWLTQAQAEWLEEIYTSKHVYVVEEVGGADNYLPIIITDRRQVMSKSRALTQIRIKYRRPELVING